MSEVPKILSNYPKLPPNFIEVNQGEWKSIEGIAGDTPLGTLAVSSCSVVAVRNMETARAYLGHFFQPHSKYQGDRESFDSMIEAIINEKTDPAHTFEAWASGTSLFAGDDEESEIHDAEALASRDYVLKSLTKLGAGTTVITNWLREREEISMVALDPTASQAIEWIKGPKPDEAPPLARSFEGLGDLLS